MAATGLHISISAETLFHIAGVPVSNSMVTSLIASSLIILLAVYFKLTYRPGKTPTGFANFFEFIVEMLYNMVQGVTGSHHKSVKFLPFIATFFIFITLNNWLGLLPGVGTIGILHTEESSESAELELAEQASYELVPVAHAAETVPTSTETTEEHATTEEPHTTFVPIFRAGTADLNTTLALAIFSQLAAQYFGFSFVGFGYLKKFFNFSNPIMFFVGILELMGEFTKVISFAFRLFGNIFAGEVLLTVIAFLSYGVLVPMPFYGLEIFVGFIQGLVFTMLSLVFFNMATISHDDH